LIGAQIRLSVDKSRVAWDQPFVLTVHMSNSTPGPIRVPWPARDDARPPRIIGATARQVAAMLDAADFLIVTGPRGRQLELRVDPIEQDPAVYLAVQSRAGDDPPTQEIAAGRADELTIPLFNRGWARFPMLRPGTYTIRFAYQPEWKDQQWTEVQFGRVQSEPVTIEITTAAPEPVRPRGEDLTLHLKTTGEMIEAEIRNVWDRPQ
jgi:hypothetical protein